MNLTTHHDMHLFCDWNRYIKWILFFRLVYRLVYFIHVLKTFKCDRDKDTPVLTWETVQHTVTHPLSATAQGGLPASIIATRTLPPSATAAMASICDNALMFNGFQRENKMWAMNNKCTVITRHNNSFMLKINPLTWSALWNYHDTLYLQAFLARRRNYRTLLLRTR